jgi:hypothetical protein
MKRHVLIVGYRRQIASRLRELDIPFVVWNDRPIKRSTIPGCTRVIDDEAFAVSPATIKQKLARLFPNGTRFTHVIAGTEASVVTASVARRIFGGRKSRDTVVLRCHNKRMMKEFLRDRGFPLIPFIYAGEKTNLDLTADEVIDQLGLPVVIKRVDASGGRGLLIARTAAEIRPFLKQRILFETFVDAPEISIETLISGRNAQFTSMTQYVEKSYVNLVPCGHAAAITSQAMELHRHVLRAMDIEWGLTHTEYYLAQNQIYFGEIAIRPPGGYIMELISLAHGFDAWNAFVDNELELSPKLDFRPTKSAAAVLFHPGAGLIELISGAQEIDLDANCERLHFYKSPGDYIEPRNGVGEVTAYAIFCSDHMSKTLKSVENAKTNLVFKMR